MNECIECGTTIGVKCVKSVLGYEEYLCLACQNQEYMDLYDEEGGK